VCKEEGVVYEATAAAPGVETKKYVGAAANSLKSRITSHTKDFKNRRYEHSTTLSSHIWALKDKGLTPTVSYKILAKARPYNPVTKKCNLCLLEKWFIARAEEGTSLNKKTEIGGKCRHRNKWLLTAWLEKG
jgi:hypothetical protein